MNSLQLVSKIRSVSSDLSSNIQEFLAHGNSINNLEKELLKKQCVDLYELLVKLKTDQEADEKPIQVTRQATPVTPSPQPIIQPVTPQSQPITPLTEVKPKNPEPPLAPPVPEVKLPEPEPPVKKVTQFKEIFEITNPEDISLDTIETSIEINEPETLEQQETERIEQKEPDIQNLPKTEIHPVEINIEKAVENKRIQYTVMPDVEEPKTVPLNALFKEREPTFNDKTSKEITPKPLAEPPIDNIKSAINLNKKIAFVNDLFRENVVEYAKAIDRLNQAGNFTEAMHIQNELKRQYNWQNEQELVQDLERLIRRRFPN